jgi:hypothetical protein
VKLSVPLPGETSCSCAEGRPVIWTCSGLASRLDKAESAATAGTASREERSGVRSKKGTFPVTSFGVDNDSESYAALL